MIVRLVQNTLSRLFGFRSKEPLFHLVEVLGFEPHDMSYYELAFRHSSVSKTDASGFKLNNERLEFLGDCACYSDEPLPILALPCMGRR